jgi:O-antigen/teichoic acid export membrane protein
VISSPPSANSDATSRWVGPRGRQILYTGAWSLVAKVAAAANVFLAIPFVLHALGPAQFGVWATLVSLVTFAGFLDFGLGNGTMNLIAAAHGRGADEEVANILHEGRRTLLWIALWLALAVTMILPLVPWTRLLGLPTGAALTAQVAAAAVLFTIVLAVPLNLATRVQLGIGRGDRAFRWQAIGQLLTLAVVIMLAKNGAPLAGLVAAAVATPLLASIANTWALWRDPQMGRSTSTRHPAIAAHIKREGLLFFVLQLAAALAFSADLPLISALRGPTDAGTYAIVQRLFSIIPLALGLIWAPLWPMYRQALAERNHDWVVKTLRRSLMLALLVALVGGVVLAAGFERIVALWVHRPLAVPGTLLVGFAVWCVIDAIGTGLATFLNAASIMKYQIITAAIFASTCFALKFLTIYYYGIWVIPWITASTFLVTSLIPVFLLKDRIIRITSSHSY